MYEFTFFEYNLIILTTSFFVFSFEIKSQAYKKYIEFSNLLSELKDYINKSINNKSPSMIKNKKSDLLELVSSKDNIFKYCLSKVANYVYHSFYLIFLLSGFGLILSSIFELNIFNLDNIYKLEWLKFPIQILAVLLFFSLLRAIFFLMCYTKIDFGYVERLREHLENKIYYDFGEIEEKKYAFKNMWNAFRIFCKIILFKILFLGFLIIDDKFKQFFYNYYNI